MNKKEKNHRLHRCHRGSALYCICRKNGARE